MHRTTVVAAVAGIVWLVLASPLVHPFPETVDGPGHQVRHALAARLPGDPVLDGFYAIAWRPIPNLAGDVAMLGLEPLLGGSLGSRVLLALGMAGWIAAPLLLQRALWRRTTAWPLVASLVVYNAVLYMGFENFYLTAPLAMALFAGWIASEDGVGALRDAGPRLAAARGLRLLGLAAAAQLVWFGHLVVWGVFALWVGTWELSRQGPLSARLGRAALAGLAFVPGLALFVAQQVSAPATHGGGTVWGTSAAQKLGLVLSPVLQYDPAVDLATLLIVLPTVIVAAIASSPRVHPRMRLVLAVFALATVLMPARLFGVGFMDQRLAPLLLGLLAGATEVRLSTFAARAVAALVAVGLVARVVTTHARWARHSAEVAEVLAAGDRLSPGARVLAAGTSALRHYHTSAYLVPRARVFVPNLFTGAHLLTVDPAVQPIDHPTPAPPSREALEQAFTGAGPFGPHADPGPDAYLRTWWTDFDALLWLSTDPPPDVGALTPLAEGSWFTLYRLPPELP